MLKKISCALISVFLLLTISLTWELPANAGVTNSSLSLASLIVARNKSPLFDSQKVRLGITPTGWSNSDDPSIDLVPPIPYRQILSEMALAGYEGSQMSGKYPQDMKTLKRELELRDFTISEPWVGTYFTIDDAEDSKKIFHQQLEFMQEIDGNTIVVAELGGAVHQQPVAPLPNRPIYSDEQWKKLTKGLNELGKEAYKAGMQLCYHPHVGTGVETLEDIDRLMAGTNPKYLKLLLDTGHLYYAGVDPLVVAKKYGDRIKHVHLKNIRQNVLKSSIAQGLSFLDSIRQGSFTVPGDKEGVIDFPPILTELAKANYEGWLVVEAEQDPNKANPLQYALMARNYLRQETGL
ncbi:MAG: myo-inosose-2 dehydratase [Cyanobacteria bacterium P01_C01_bin.72]